MRALFACLIVAAGLAGCADPAESDGKAHVYVVAADASAFVEIRSDEGVVWSARLGQGEGRLATFAVPAGACLDVTLFAGFEGREPDEPVRLLRVCDADPAPVRAEIGPA